LLWFAVVLFGLGLPFFLVLVWFWCWFDFAVSPFPQLFTQLILPYHNIHVTSHHEQILTA
jgi:hypothetical protein